MNRKRWAGLGLLAVAAAVAAVLLLVRPIAKAPFQPGAWVPRDADLVAWIDGLQPLGDGLRSLGSKVGGAQGLPEALALVADVDLLDPQAIERVGLRPDAGLVAFRFRDALWLAVPVAGDRGVAHLLGVLRKRGYTLPDLPNGPWPVGARGEPGREVARLWRAQGPEDGGDVLLGRLPLAGQAEPEAEHAALKQAPRLGTLPGGPGVGHLRARLAPDGPELKAAHAAVGPANLLIGGAIDKIQRLEADLQVAGGAPRLTVHLVSAPGQLDDFAKYHMGFLGQASTLDLGDLLPDETPLLVRARLNPALLGLIPGVLRDRLLPASLLGVLHPALVGVDASQLLVAAWEGQVAAGVLSVADDVPLDPGQWPRLDPRAAVRGFVAVSLQSDLAAQTLVERCRAALETSPERPETVQLRAWAGFQVPGPGAPWLLLRKGRQVALVSGTGTREDLQRIAEGKFPDLGQFTRPGLERELVQGDKHWLGLLGSTPRVARSLRRRGVPDYAVQMLASVATVAAGLELLPDRFTLRLELRPADDSDDQEVH